MTDCILGIWGGIPSALRELVVGLGIVVVLSQPVSVYTERQSHLSAKEIEELGAQLLKKQTIPKAKLTQHTYLGDEKTSSAVTKPRN